MPFYNVNVLWHGTNVEAHTSYITTHVAPNYKAIFYVEWGNCTFWYMLESMMLSTIWTIASIWPSSHTSQCETGRWGTSDESGRLCGRLCGQLCPKQVWVSHFHTLLYLWSYSTIAFHTYLTKPNPCTNFSHNHIAHSWLQHLSVKFFNIEIHYSLSQVSHNM